MHFVLSNNKHTKVSMVQVRQQGQQTLSSTGRLAIWSLFRKGALRGEGRHEGGGGGKRVVGWETGGPHQNRWKFLRSCTTLALAARQEPSCDVGV